MLAHRGWRTDWTTERPCLYWYLTFQDQPALRSLVDEVADDLRRVPSIDVVPPAWLHLTLLEVGFAEQVSPQAIDDLLAATRAALEPRPLAVELGPLTTMTDAVVLTVRPTPQVMALRSALDRSLQACLGPGPEAEEFWPHVSLAYTNRDCRREDVMRPLADVADRTTTVAVPHLTLAAVTRERDHYRWSAVAELPLGGESAAS